MYIYILYTYYFLALPHARSASLSPFLVFYFLFLYIFLYISLSLSRSPSLSLALSLSLSLCPSLFVSLVSCCVSTSVSAGAAILPKAGHSRSAEIASKQSLPHGSGLQLILLDVLSAEPERVVLPSWR